MTREEALEILDTIETIGDQVDALEMAISALNRIHCQDCKYYAPLGGINLFDGDGAWGYCSCGLKGKVYRDEWCSRGES